MNAQQTIEDREATHGDYLKQAATAQRIKDELKYRMTGGVFSPDVLESLDMIAVKLSRIVNGNPEEADHWVDIAGYATLVANRIRTGNHLGSSDKPG